MSSVIENVSVQVFKTEARTAVDELERLQPGGVVVIPLATLEALGELRPLLDRAGLMVRISQLQAWRGQPLGEGTRLMPMNPCIVLSGTKQ